MNHEINRTVTAEVEFTDEEKSLLRKSVSNRHIEAPFKKFPDEYTSDDLYQMADCLKKANRIGILTGDEAKDAYKLACSLEDLSYQMV